MKKLLSMALTVVLVLSMIGCVADPGGEIKKPDNVSTNNADSNDPQHNSETKAPEKKAATIAETVLVDEAGVKITAKSLAEDGIFGPELKLLIENNSGKDLTFQCRNTSVNGYMVETMLSADVVDGKKANDEITFMRSDLEACGIETIADMELYFHIFSSTDWQEYLDTAKIQIKTSVADTYEYKFDDSGDVAYEGNGAKIVVKGLSQDSIFGPGIVVYIENNGDEDITVQTRDVSINGFMIDAMFSCDIAAGKRAVDSITFMESDLEDNEITKIETVELSFHIFSADDWDTIVDTDVVEITFQ